MANMYTENDLMNHYNLKPADRIVVPKSGLMLVQHHALYLGYNEYGQHWISENKIGQGVVFTRAKDFFRENPGVTRIERYSGSDYARETVVRRAFSDHGRSYDLINYNCEHHVNNAVEGQARSPQVAVGGALAGLALLIGIAALLGRGK